MKVPNQPTNQSSGPRSPIYQVSDYGTNLGFAPVNPRGAGYAPAQLQQPRHKMMPMMRQAFNMSGVQTPWQFQQQQKAAEAAHQATNPFPQAPADINAFEKDAYNEWLTEVLKWYYGEDPSKFQMNFNLGNLGFPQ